MASKNYGLTGPESVVYGVLRVGAWFGVVFCATAASDEKLQQYGIWVASALLCVVIFCLADVVRWLGEIAGSLRK